MELRTLENNELEAKARNHFNFNTVLAYKEGVARLLKNIA